MPRTGAAKSYRVEMDNLSSSRGCGDRYPNEIHFSARDDQPEPLRGSFIATRSDCDPCTNTMPGM
ncbi:hypothetical protein RMSM_05569 [Rhodopirellula maiorica SM1]|uniref:Uncharacterized protein n=1 Tax=Rhodopirellula maiorica SM1 TaxID=1265738 RepID=M5RU46_9BACT|nr:hypothetical protein RMSM_05569 [Rhodopirellula maiorica SM1]